MTTPAPDHLDAKGPGRRLWKSVVAEFSLEDHHKALLEVACSQLDRMDEARRRVKQDGAYIPDRFGQLRPHAAIAVERDAATLHLRALRELGLDVQEPGESRPPQIRGNNKLRLAGGRP